jgi:hypothetical protein
LPDFAFQGVVPRRGGSFSERELELLPEETFRELWESFRTRSPAMKGWVRIETIGRFPEFIKWLRSGND